MLIYGFENALEFRAVFRGEWQQRQAQTSGTRIRGAERVGVAPLMGRRHLDRVPFALSIFTHGLVAVVATLRRTQREPSREGECAG